jgi:hypothetical protein
MEELIAFFGEQRRQMMIFNEKVSKESEDFPLRLKQILHKENGYKNMQIFFFHQNVNIPSFYIVL